MVNLTVTTSPVDAFQVINNLTIVNGIPIFGVSILVMVWLIVYVRTRGQTTKVSLATATFFMSIVALPLAFLELVPDDVTGIAITLAIICAAILYNE